MDWKKGKHLSWDTLIDVLKVIGLSTLTCDGIRCTELLFEQGIISVQLFNVYIMGGCFWYSVILQTVKSALKLIASYCFGIFST